MKFIDKKTPTAARAILLVTQMGDLIRSKAQIEAQFYSAEK
jgi:hypothetical protein